MTSLILILSLGMAVGQDAEDTEAAEATEATEATDATEATEATEAAEATATEAPDRSEPPVVLDAVPLDLPTPVEHALSEAVTVYLVNVPGVRKVQVRAFIERGGLDMDEWPTTAAIATGWLQDVATEDHDAGELDIIKDLHDVSVWSSRVGLHRSKLSLEVPLEDLDVGLGLFAEVLLEPKYPGKEVKRYIRESTRWYLDEAHTSADTVASSLMTNAWYPAEHPYGARPDLEDIAGLKRGDLLERHEWLLDNAPIRLLVVGDVTWEDLEPMLAPIFEGIGAPGALVPQPEFTPPAEGRIVAADMPGVEQTVLYLRMGAPLLGHEDQPVMEVVDWALGGHFLSRLNKNLREEKGFTYGSHSWYGPDYTRAHWTMTVEVGAENTAAAIAEIEKEVEAVVTEGITAEEISASRLEAIAEWNTVQQTAESAFWFFEELLVEDETTDDVRARIDLLETLEPAQTQTVAERWLSTDQPRLWVVVGPREIIEPQLEELGWEVEWYTPEQAVLGEVP